MEKVSTRVSEAWMVATLAVVVFTKYERKKKRFEVEKVAITFCSNVKSRFITPGFQIENGMDSFLHRGIVTRKGEGRPESGNFCTTVKPNQGRRRVPNYSSAASMEVLSLAHLI